MEAVDHRARRAGTVERLAIGAVQQVEGGDLLLVLSRERPRVAVTRIDGRSGRAGGGWRCRRGAPGRRRTGCGRRCSRRWSTIPGCAGPRCSTCAPGRGRWGWRRCPAGRRTRCSSSRDRRAAGGAAAQRRRGRAGRARGAGGAGGGGARGAGRPGASTWCSSTRPTRPRTPRWPAGCAAAAHGWLADDAVVVVERSARGPRPWPPVAAARAPLRRDRAAHRRRDPHRWRPPSGDGDRRSAPRRAGAGRTPSTPTAITGRDCYRPAHEARRLPRLLRPADPRPPRRHRSGGRAVRRGRRRGAGEQEQEEPVHGRGADGDARRDRHAVPERRASTRSTACSSTTAASTTSARSSRACARSPTSTTSCRWPR